MIQLPDLPITTALPALCGALRERASAVLEAPPGAGKSTVVPLALLEEPWVRGRRLLMLEPRRLAARAVAERMAATLGERVGGTVGLRMRLDTRVSRLTRIEVVTEGVLTRLLQNDPALEGVAAVIFDEFHERSLQADLGLTLCLDARATLGTDLRLLVMSATLDGAAIARWLGDVPVVSSPGRMFPVDIRYAGRGLPALPGDVDSPERVTALAIERALRDEVGDILVFLPGAGEIRRVRDHLLSKEAVAGDVQVMPLYGELSAAEQDAALAPENMASRRVILATNIAETSLTLPNIRIVIDSGLVRRAVFDPVTGMSRLETRRISRASADQRAGRAGRVAEGICIRLWSEGGHRSLAAHTPPEIHEADLASLALDLALWGAGEGSALSWLDAPPSATLASACDLLRRLDALDEQGRISTHGRTLGEWATHPRIAHLLLESRRRGVEALGARLAALLGERDILRGSTGAGLRDADVTTRLDLLDGTMRHEAVDRGALARARETAARFARQLATLPPGRTAPALDAGGLLACAYPDRVGRRRSGGGGRYQLANGRGAVFAPNESLAQREFVVALDLDDRDREARILLAAPLDRAALNVALGHQLRTDREVRWDSKEQAVIAREVRRLESLVLDERTLTDIPADATLDAVLEGIREAGLDALPWEEESRHWCARVELARREGLPGTADWPAFDPGSLYASLDQWLAPWLPGIARRSHFARIPLAQALAFRLGHERIRQLDEWLPTHIVVPTGSRIRVDYLDDLAPCASMRMQEVFGLAATPRIALGHLPVTFKLLSPAQRPLQVTADLASFWANAYADVRKDMRGRYPRHYWPEDPQQAEPTRSVRKRS